MIQTLHAKAKVTEYWFVFECPITEHGTRNTRLGAVSYLAGTKELVV
jgi:hypothetical protein